MNSLKRLNFVFMGLGLAALSLAAGCTQTDFTNETIGGEDGGDGDGDGDEGPGEGAYDEDVACEVEDDCAGGETCIEGVCQMKRCFDGPYDSQAPIGSRLKFFLDQEVVVLDTLPVEGDFYIDGYQPEGDSFEYPGSWNTGGSPLLDVTGGDFYGENPDRFAYIRENDKRIHIGDDEETIELTFQPMALASGDVDRDKIDEIIALGEFGNVASCNVMTGQCASLAFQGATGKDVAAGDVDGDGFFEPIFLLENGGSSNIYVWQADPDTEDEDISELLEDDVERVTAGDLGEDGVDEVMFLDEGGNFDDARILTYSFEGGGPMELGSQVVSDSVRDIEAGDLDMDNSDELAVVREDGQVDVYQGVGGSNIQLVGSHQLQVSAAPFRIAVPDFDGDSPSSRLVDDEPALLAGQAVPAMVLHLPPYDAEWSLGESRASYGESESMSESLTDSVSLGIGLDFGLRGGIPGVVGVKVGAGISKDISFSNTITTRQSIGTRYSFQANPMLFGQSYGAVVLSCGCFHGYTYEVIDPANKLEGNADGEPFVMITPVGGNNTIWSTQRYNAMAEQVDGLPVIDIPYKVGDPTSYPATPVLADGETPVPAEDLVFGTTPNVAVSDVGSVSFRLTVGETETNSTSLKTSLSASFGGQVGPFEAGVKLSYGFGESYSLAVGESAFFSGSIPMLPDNPETPEDEYLTYGYGTQPYVYRQHYTDAEGNDAAFYVMSYTVGQ